MKIHCSQVGAARERRTAQVGDTVGDRDAGQAGAVIERILADAGDAAAKSDVGQAGAGKERGVPDVGDAVGDGDAGQAGAVIERIGADAGDAFGDGVASGLARRKCNESSVVLVEQDPGHNAINGIVSVYSDGHQVGAAQEDTVPEVGDTGGSSRSRN